MPTASVHNKCKPEVKTVRHLGKLLGNLSRRWLVEKGFGWLKQIGPLRQVKLRGTQPAPATKANCTTITGKAQGAVCLKLGSGLLDRLREAGKAASTQDKTAFQTDFHSTIA
jgi:hypothetical protein